MAKKPCVALKDYNTKTHLSDDCKAFLKCSITEKGCIARVIDDRDDESTQFFSRAKARFDKDKAKKCPIYGNQNLVLKVMSNEV